MRFAPFFFCVAKWCVSHLLFFVFIFIFNFGLNWPVGRQYRQFRPIQTKSAQIGPSLRHIGASRRKSWKKKARCGTDVQATASLTRHCVGCGCGSSGAMSVLPRLYYHLGSDLSTSRYLFIFQNFVNVGLSDLSSTWEFLQSMYSSSSTCHEISF